MHAVTPSYMHASMLAAGFCCTFNIMLSRLMYEVYVGQQGRRFRISTSALPQSGCNRSGSIFSSALRCDQMYVLHVSVLAEEVHHVDSNAKQCLMDWLICRRQGALAHLTLKRSNL